MMMKRIVSLLLALSMLFGMTGTALAADVGISAYDKPVDITLNQNEVCLIKGETVTLVPTLASDLGLHDVQWTSSDTSIATVDSKGVVKGLNYGNVTITATAGGSAATCEVHVVALAYTVEDLRVPRPDERTYINAIMVNGADIVSVDRTDYFYPIVYLDAETTDPGAELNIYIDISGMGYSLNMAIDNKLILSEPVKKLCLEHSVELTNGFATEEIYVQCPESGGWCYFYPTYKCVSVTLDKASVSMEAGTREKLNATVKGSDMTALEWASNDEAVATVDQNGYVTAIGSGKAILTATEPASGYTASCEIIVGIPVEDTVLSLNKTELTLERGTSETLIPSFTGAAPENPQYLWASSDDTVVSVENGVVKGLRTGDAVVHVTCGEYTASCAVTVTGDPIYSGMFLNPKKVTLGKDCSVDLNITILDSEISESDLRWFSDNRAVARVEDGKVTGIGYGETTVYAKCGDYQAVCTVTVAPVLYADGDWMIVLEEPEDAERTVLFVDNSDPMNPIAYLNYNISNTEDIPVLNAPAEAEVGAVQVTDGTAAQRVTANGKIWNITYKTSSLMLEQTELTLSAGKCVLLEVFNNGTDDATLTWESDNEEVAVVRNGVVSAIGAGEASIKVTAGGVYTDDCKITVIPNENESGVYTVKTHVGNVVGKPGEMISVPLYVDAHDFPALKNGQNFYVSFDPEILKFKGVSVGSDAEKYGAVASYLYPFDYPTGKIARVDIADSWASALIEGEVLCVNFEVKDDAPDGIYSVDFTGFHFPLLNGGIIVDRDGNLLTESVPGNIWVSSGEDSVSALASFNFENVTVRDDEDAIVSVMANHDLEDKVKSLQIKPSYDAEMLTLTGAEAGEDLEGAYVSLRDDIVTIQAEDGFELPQGEVLKLTFSPKEAVPDGEYAVTLNSKDQSGNRIVDINGSSNYALAGITGAVQIVNYYTINLEISGDGTINGPEKAKNGDTVTLVSTPGEGKYLESITVTDADGNSVELKGNTFTMPGSEVTVKAVFADQINVNVKFRMIGGTLPGKATGFGNTYNGTPIPDGGYGQYYGAEYQNWIMPQDVAVAAGTTAGKLILEMLDKYELDYSDSDLYFAVKSPKVLSDVRGEWLMKPYWKDNDNTGEQSTGWRCGWVITILRDGKYIEFECDDGFSFIAIDHFKANTASPELMEGDEVIFHWSYEKEYELLSGAGVNGVGYADGYVQEYLKVDERNNYTPEETAIIWNAIDRIDEIGVVNRSSGPKIEAAEVACNIGERLLLSVKNYQTLLDARKIYDNLVATNQMNPPVLRAEDAVEETDKETMKSSVIVPTPDWTIADDMNAVVQYRISTDKKNWGNWQDSNLFIDLNPGTSYYFQARFAGSETYNDSEPSGAIRVVTPHVVRDRTEWQKAVNSAPKDGTRTIIKVADTFDISKVGQATIRIPLGSNVVVVGDGGMLKSSAGGFNSNGIAVGTNSTLTLKNLTYETIGPRDDETYMAENANFGALVYFMGENAVVNVENVVFYGDSCQGGKLFMSEAANCVLNIYSGSFNNIAVNSGKVDMGYNQGGAFGFSDSGRLEVNLLPVGNISIVGKVYSPDQLTVNLIPQEGKPIVSASKLLVGYRKYEDLASSLDEMNQASEKIPYQFETDFGGLRVNVVEDTPAIPAKLTAPDVDAADISMDKNVITVPSLSTHPELKSTEQSDAVLQYRILKFDGAYWKSITNYGIWRCENRSTFTVSLEEDTDYRLEMRYASINGEYQNSDSVIIPFRSGYNPVQLASPYLSGEANREQNYVALSAPSKSTQDSKAILEYRVSKDQENWSEWQESLEFNDLEAGTKYYFQARYKAGHYLWTDSEGSEIVEISTRAPLLNAPELSDKAEVTNNSVKLTVPDASDEDPAAKVQYRISDDGDNWYGDWQDNPLFENLEGSTVYYFQARYVSSTEKYLNSKESIMVGIMTKRDPSGAAILVSEVRGYAGKTVEVAVELQNNPGIVTATLVLDYNSDVLELVGASNGDLFDDRSFSFSADTLYWSDASSDINEDGILAKLTFKVKENAEFGEGDVSISYSANDVYNAGFDNVDFVVVDGMVIIENALTGDVNCDGKVDAKDVTILRRYLADWTEYGEDTLDLAVADLDGDSVVTSKDVTWLSRAIALWEGYSLTTE